MSNRSPTASGQKMYREMKDHLTGAEWTETQNRSALGRFKKPRNYAWQMFEQMGDLPKPSDMQATLAWCRKNFAPSEEHPVPAMARIDRNSTKHNTTRVLEVVRPIVKDAVDYCIRKAGKNSKMADLIAIPLTNRSLTESMMGTAPLNYDGTEVHLPFDQNHVLFQAGFCAMRDLDDVQLAAMLNLGPNGSVGQSKFTQAKRFLSEVQRTVFFTLMKSVTQVFTLPYRIEWVDFVNSYYTQYEHNCALAATAGGDGAPVWTSLHPATPFPTIQELIGWVMEGRTDPGLLLPCHDGCHHSVP